MSSRYPRRVATAWLIVEILHDDIETKRANALGPTEIKYMEKIDTYWEELKPRWKPIPKSVADQLALSAAFYEMAGETRKQEAKSKSTFRSMTQDPWNS